MKNILVLNGAAKKDGNTASLVRVTDFFKKRHLSLYLLSMTISTSSQSIALDIVLEIIQ